MIRAKRLSRKAVIGIIAPASPQRDHTRLTRGIRYLEGLGHTVVLGKHLHHTHEGYLAGTDEQRLADLHDMFADTRIDAIFCSRGGYGTARMLQSVNYPLIKRNPKIFVGFSDTTSLQLALLKRTGLITFSGAMPSVDMADGFDPYSEEFFWRALTSTKPLGVIKQPSPLTVVQKGEHQGKLIAGNLSVFTTLIGTPYMPSLKDCVLALEDIDEATYRIDRMFMHLANAGLLQQARSLITGYWSQSSPSNRSTPHRPVEHVVKEAAQFVKGPVLSNLLYGHESVKMTLPLGILTKVSTSKPTIKLLDAALT